jgi:PAS domain S-box-containing protein
MSSDKQQLQILFDVMPQLGWAARPDGWIDYYNRRWYEYTGATPDAMAGWGWQSVHHPEILPRVVAQWRRSIDTGEPFEMAFPLRRHDGVFRWFLTRATAMRDAAGTIVRWVGINTDIDDQKRAETKLAEVDRVTDGFAASSRDNETRLRLALDAAQLGAWELDPATDRGVGTPRHAELFGYTTLPADWGSRRFLDHVHPDDRDHVRAELGAALAGTTPHRIAARIVTAAGVERHVEIHAMTAESAHGRRAFGTLADVTERVLAERERKQLLARESQARAAAEEASRAKDEFLAMLGHELRNPLAPIVTALQLLELRGEGASRECQVIKRQVEHLGGLLDDLLDVARITRGKVELRRQPVELADVVAKAIEVAGPLLEQRRHELAVDVPPGLVVDGDPVRLAQIVSNLLTNAAKYTPPAGHVAIRAARSAAGIELHVRDDGIGIAPDVLPTIFDPFAQAPQSIDRTTGGLGLGLAIVRNLVELHGGTVAAHSDGLGRGTELVVTLPASSEPVTAQPQQHHETETETETELAQDASPQPQPHANGKRVLIVDDNRDAAEMLAEFFTHHGFATEIAGDGPSAIQIAARWQPQFVLLDIGLPVMDGYEVIRRLRELPELHGAFIAAVTGYGQPNDRARALEAGFDLHVVKPIDIHKLIALIESRGAPGE